VFYLPNLWNGGYPKEPRNAQYQEMPVTVATIARRDQLGTLPLLDVQRVLHVEEIVLRYIFDRVPSSSILPSTVLDDILCD